MIRLQRVTFLALHNYLGLTTELTHPNCIYTPVQHKDDSQKHKIRHSHINVNTQAEVSTNTLNRNEADSTDNERLGSSKPIPITSCNSLSYDSPTTPASQINNNSNVFEGVEASSNTEETNPISIPAQKHAVIFSNPRSISVVESGHMKPDFEEAAARARVKNSLDTTFFEKHKKSYRHASSNRATSYSSTQRRSSFSDVKLHFCRNLHFCLLFNRFFYIA